MKDPYLLHIFNPTKNVSPFDVNMAYEAEYDGVIPYTNVTLEEVHALTQDTIFSRGPTGARRTGIFIGGREFGLAMDMLNRARTAMVPPFQVSVFADPSGAITTAAAMVACTEQALKEQGTELAGRTVHVFGGTGPVGICAGVLAADCGADVHLLSHRGKEVAAATTREYNARNNVEMKAVSAGTEEEVEEILSGAEIIFGAAKAGIRVVNRKQLAQAQRLLVAADVNAVPPSGIEGIDVNDKAKPLETASGKAVGIGALAVGDVKYKVHRGLFEMMMNGEEPCYLDHREAFKKAREIVGN
ncbi:MAG: NAD(P)-dependent methylenetetrahydromethanopterin dehydrogenase [Gammaproteobacteria bacterium]